MPTHRNIGVSPSNSGAAAEISGDWRACGSDRHGCVAKIEVGTENNNMPANTDQDLLQQTLRSLQRLEQAQRIGQIGDFQCNLVEHRIDGSAECFRILGFGESAGTVNLDLVLGRVIDEDRPRIAAELARLETADVEDFAFDCDLLVQGEQRCVSARGIVERRDDEAAWLVGVVQDVTSRQESERETRDIAERLHENQRLASLGSLAGGVAHDFNNLLVGILGNADLALTEPQIPAEVSRRLEDVVSASRRAADLTNQLLAYSGKGRFVVQSTNLNEIVRDVITDTAHCIPPGCELRRRMAESLPAIDCDVAQMRQVIMNLILNAAEAIDDDAGVITLTTGVQTCSEEYLKATLVEQDFPRGRYVFIEVTDNGCGMDEATRARVFEPFFTTKFSGRGLGMSAALGIIKSHNGTLTLSSDVSHGTGVRVLIPAVETKAITAREHDSPSDWAGTGTVLVIDDEPAVRQLAARVLEGYEFAVITAANGQEGIDLFREHTEDINLVILDLNMPRLDGEETFWELRQIKPDVKVILTSGYDEQEATSAFVGKGLAGFVAKPFLAHDLLKAIKATF